MKDNRASGFTLIELIIVILIIGIMAAMAVPYFLKAQETSKANQGMAVASMVASSNRMYAVDHSATDLDGTIGSNCNGNSSGCGVQKDQGCWLVDCGYMSQQDWSSLPYAVEALSLANSCDANPLSNCQDANGNGPAKNSLMACAWRQGTTTSPYASWGYEVDNTGDVYACGPDKNRASDAPTPPQG